MYHCSLVVGPLTPFITCDEGVRIGHVTTYVAQHFSDAFFVTMSHVTNSLNCGITLATEKYRETNI